MKTKGKNWSQQYKIVCEIYFKSDHAREYGPTKLGLARCLGASQGKTQNWEKGQWPSASDLAVMADRLGCSYRWLVTGEGDPLDGHAAPPVAPPPRANGPIRMVGLASCGVVGWNQIMPVAVSAAAPEVGEKAVAVIAFGESMVPAGISSGQVCYADPEQAPLQGDAVYVARRDGLAAVKLYLGEGERAGWLRLKGWLDPDQDGQRKPFFVDMPQEQIETIAPVIYVRRRL